MVRRLTLVLVLTALIFPCGAFALGLGDLHLKSALNQDFNAEIALLSVKTDELDGVKVILASPAAFQKAGVDRPFILTKLRFKPDLNAEGKVVIHVTSREAIREPFLNFLIEVNWAKGRLVREYTVLLDPPVTMKRRPPHVAPPTARPPVPQPAAPVAQQPVQQTYVAPQPTYVPPEPAGPWEYGPVQANDTLWNIAQSNRPQGVSVQQMMVALQRKNPHAFFKDNVNNLKRGAILRIPTQEEIDHLSEREARTEFSSQLAQWKAERASAPMPEMEAGTAEEEPSPEAEGDTLELASVRPEAEGEAGPSEGEDAEKTTASLENELILAREQNESTQQERDELNSQVKELESQLSDMKEMLTIRNEQLARLEAAFDKKASEEESAVAEVEEELELGIAETAEDETLEELELVVEEETELEIEDTPEGEPLADMSAESEATPSVATQEDAAATPESRQVKSWTDSLPSSIEEVPAFLTDQLEKNPIAVAGAGGGFIVLLLLLLMLSRRKASDDEFQESILVSSDVDDVEALDSDVAEDTETPLSETAETSFLSEFSHSDLDAGQEDTGEVDPMAEADVYIAYGRYQQAEELVRQAINGEPDRLSYQYKLLEILSASGNSAEYTKLAEELAENEDVRADSDAWEKIISMGHKLNPGHALFAAAAGVGAVGVDEALSAETEDQAPVADVEESGDELEMPGLSDLAADFDLDEEAAEQKEPEKSGEDVDDLSFDLDLESSTDNEPAEDESALSLELGGLEDEGLADEALVAEGYEEPEASTAEESDLLDLDGLDLGDLEDSLNVSADEATEEALDSLEDLDLGDLESELDVSGAEAGLGLEEASSEGLSSPDELADTLSNFTDDLTLDETLESGDLDESISSFTEGLVQSEENETGELEETLSDLTEDLMLGEEPEAESLEDTLSDISLDDLDLGELGEAEDVESLEAVDTLPDLPEGEDLLGDELEIEESGGELLSELAEDEDDLDEVSTKLDLARAYVEMGDEEGARNILDEVMGEGDEAQKKEAEELIARFS